MARVRGPQQQASPFLATTVVRGPAGANAVFGMLLFVACEAMFFAGLISAFIVLRAGAEAWPPPDQPRFPVAMTGLNTLVLLASAWTMRNAHHAIGRGYVAALQTWLRWTVLLGATFLGIQGIEWTRLVAHGLRVVGTVYGGLFVALIGMHALHVLGGVGALLWTWRHATQRRWTLQSHDGVTAVAIYWMFVVAVWPVLYLLVYVQ